MAIQQLKQERRKNPDMRALADEACKEAKARADAAGLPFSEATWFQGWTAACIYMRDHSALSLT